VDGGWRTLDVEVEKRREMAPAAECPVETPSKAYWILGSRIVRVPYVVVKLGTRRCRSDAELREAVPSASPIFG
jgi:hypothetical protein